jgi:cellulose synthase/poly-beta-1,6-N-acetylglucosamine synthase-like glycosyltransferase
MHVVTVPDGPLKTKPRALNYALPFARGSIVGIYDAEDAPAPDQLRKVAARFASAPAEVGCLQGILDYYNPRTNWIARCFTLEYAIWFRVVMPGLERLGVPLPLGGTTLFVRRSALEAVGAWDAHNVTEDADLGIRLAANGYRTEMLPSTTEEEANCRPRAWIRQRSRWIKGHMLTWAVHMRRPGRLRRAVGWRGFIGYQIVFFGAQSQFLLAPVLWSFWLIAAGVGHPAAAIMPPTAFAVLIGLVVAAEALGLVLAVRAGRMTRHAGLWLWAPTLHLYFPLATFAAWRAAAEIVRRPFYWAKTSHGHFDTTLAPADAPANPPGRAAAGLSAS